MMMLHILSQELEEEKVRVNEAFNMESKGGYWNTVWMTNKRSKLSTIKVVPLRCGCHT